MPLVLQQTQTQRWCITVQDSKAAASGNRKAAVHSPSIFKWLQFSICYFTTAANFLHTGITLRKQLKGPKPSNFQTQIRDVHSFLLTKCTHILNCWVQREQTSRERKDTMPLHLHPLRSRMLPFKARWTSTYRRNKTCLHCWKAMNMPLFWSALKNMHIRAPSYSRLQKKS